MATIFDTEWDGARGTIQPPKNIIETYTRFGDNRVWVQGIRREANQSTIQAWVVVDDAAEAQAYMMLLNDSIGLQGVVKLDDEIEYRSAYLLDCSFNYRVLKPSHILEGTFTIIVDEREGTDDAWLGESTAAPNNLA